KFYASVRIDVRRIGQLKNTNGPCGSRTRVKVVKNKLAPPFQVAEFDIRWGEGIDRIGELMDEALALDVITRRGAYLSFAGENLGQGREKARAAIVNSPTLFAALSDAAATAKNHLEVAA
ncbi:MAG TPA: DNA recombination/repair protein RecA, partial [Sorangium sp.]|nr:DNA recombination/repair protein RecA [Sorangium sp.]